MPIEDNVSDKVLTSLRRIMRAADLHSRQLLRQCGLTSPQLSLLKIICGEGSLSQGELAARLSLSNATVSGIVDRLEKRRLVVRSRDHADRRHVIVRATQAGRDVLQQAPPILQERFLTELHHLPEETLTQILSSLESVSRMMNAENLDVAPLLSGEPLDSSPSTASGEEYRDRKNTPAAKSNQRGEMDMSAKEVKDKKKDVSDVQINVYRSASEFPSWLTVQGLAEFLHEALKPYEDTVEDIKSGIEYAFSDESGKGGFVLVAEQDKRPLGALVMLKTGMSGYIPENILVFVAVDPSARGMGLGGKLVQKGFDTAEGDVKLHVEYDNPAKRLYERLGMVTKYAEMRYHK
jgi:DNA-binding MarR family transcriptional regulator/ribosomal protein S18 acetylase RimI-like enzyme